MAYDIGPRIGVDGEAEFRKQITNINNSLKTLKTEMTKVTSAFSGNEKSQWALIAKNKVLTQQIETQKKKVQEANRAWEEASKKYGENSNEALKWKSVLNTAETQLNGLEQELNSNNEALDKIGQGFAQSSQEAEKMKRSLEDVNRLLDLDPGNTELIAQKHRLLQEEINQTKDRLGQLKEADKIAKQQLANGELGQDKYDELQREIVETEQKLKQLKNTVGSGSATMAKISAETGKFGEAASGAGKKLMPLSIGAAGVGIAIGKMAVDFESAFAGVKKTVDGTDQQLETIRQGIMKLAESTSSSAEEIAGVAEAAGQLGIEADNILGFTETMVKLGDTTNLSATEAASSLAKFANITKTSAGDYDKLGAVIVALGNNFATTEADIVQMSTRLAATGDLAGFSESQIFAISAAISSVGIEAEAGGNAFSKLTKKIQVAVETGNGDLQRFASVAGVSVGEFKQSFEQDAVGAIGKFITGLNDTERNGKSAVAVLDDMGIKETRLSNTVLSLASNSDVLTGAIDTANTAWNENTALTDEANQRYGTTEAKFKQVGEAFKNAARSIGDQLIPYLQKAADFLKELANKFSGLSDGQKKAVLGIIGFTMAIGPLLSGIGKVSKGISSVTGLFSKLKISEMLAGITGPIAAIVAAVAAAVAAFVYLWQTNEEFRNNMIGIWNRIKDAIVPILRGIMDSLKALWEAMKPIVDWVLNTLAPVFESAFSIIGDVITGVLKAFQGLLDFVIGVFTGDWSRALDGIMNIFSGAFDAVTGVLQGVFDAIVGVFANVWESVKGPLTSAWAGIMEFFKNTWTSISDTAVMIFGGIATFFSNVWTGISTYFQEIWNNIKTFFTETILGIVTLAQQYFGDFILNIQNMFTAAKDFFFNIWEVIKNVFMGAVLLIIDLVTGDFQKLKEDAINIFNNLQTAFTNIWESIKTFLFNMLDGIKNYATGIWNAMRDTVINVFNAVKTFIVNTFNNIKTTFVNIWNGIKSFFTNAVNNIKTAGINAFNNMKSGISNTVTNIKNAIVNGINNAVTWIKSLPGQAFSWGKDFIQGLVRGIQSMIGKVTGAVKNLAGKIRSFLHFSRPDEGPLREYETWMPDFMSGLAKGIKFSEYKVLDKVEGLAENIQNAMQISGDMSASMAVSGSGQLIATVPVYIGNTKIDEYVTTVAINGLGHRKVNNTAFKGGR